MNICFLSYSKSGGAGKATVKLFNSIKKKKIKCSHIFKIKDKRVNYVENFKEKINRHSQKFERKKIDSFKSLSLFSYPLWKRINNSNFDIVHLTWINELLSIEDINKINKPIVWTLCDMWPITGLNHYDNYKENALWKKKNFFKKKSFSLDRWLISRKIKSWKNINIVSPSKWLFECSKESVITHKFKKYIIPWPIDRNIFKRRDKIKLRKKYKIPINKKYIIYNAYNGIKDPRKGWDYLLKAIKISKESFDLLIIGEKKNLKIKEIKNRKIFSLGKINSDIKISEILNCADLIVIPSKIDNLPQVGLEAQSCGLPVVTFNCNGLKDLVDHKKNGFLAKPYSPTSFSSGIDWILRRKSQKNLIQNSINKTKKNWDSNIVSKKYIGLYKKILKKKEFK